MSVHPEITVSVSQIPTSTTTQTFYFQRRFGSITEIRAETEKEACDYYYRIILPFLFLPQNDTCCCVPTFSSGRCNIRQCSRTHLLYSKMEDNCFAKYVKILHKLLTCGIAERWSLLFNEEPRIVPSNYAVEIRRPDGMTEGHNPRTFTYIWNHANVKYITTQKSSKPFDECMRKLLDLTDNELCWGVIDATLRALTVEQRDLLMGSLEPKTERPAPVLSAYKSEPQPPTETDSQVILKTPSVRRYLPWQSLRYRRDPYPEQAYYPICVDSQSF
jgi:hypothetical protein